MGPEAAGTSVVLPAACPSRVLGRIVLLGHDLWRTEDFVSQKLADSQSTVGSTLRRRWLTSSQAIRHLSSTTLTFGTWVTRAD